jgi:hypothetical protein
MLPYNGYSGKERAAKLRARNQRRRKGLETATRGPCSLCGDPDAVVEPHSEDYSEPFLWQPPAEWPLCYVCHRIKLHGRFRDPLGWEAYKAHVRRGGYARDLKDRAVQRELRALKAALARGRTLELRRLRPEPAGQGAWWESLSSDAAALTSRGSRPRP